jgi:HK97 family phage major capsid protein
MGVLEATGYAVDTVGLNPMDWAAMQIIKGDDGHYVYFNPGSTTNLAPMWGKPVVASPEVPVGKFLLGAFQVGAQLFEREGASVQAGYQNDDFTRNLVTLLAELRAVLAIYATAAFRKGDLY